MSIIYFEKTNRNGDGVESMYIFDGDDRNTRLSVGVLNSGDRLVPVTDRIRCYIERRIM